MKNIKILFQGDSITDWGRDYNDSRNLGGGYPRFASEIIRQNFPEVDFDFINLGIGGNRTHELVDRLQRDFIDVQPDIVSILIGINDVWSRSADRNWDSNDDFEMRYRTILKEIREKTKAKIMLIEPYLIPFEDKAFLREDLDPKIQVVRKLAREYADVLLPADGLMNSAVIGQDLESFSMEGVHLTDKGASYLATFYGQYISPIIQKLIDETDDTK